MKLKHTHTHTHLRGFLPDGRRQNWGCGANGSGCSEPRPLRLTQTPPPSRLRSVKIEGDKLGGFPPVFQNLPLRVCAFFSLGAAAASGQVPVSAAS